jgi:diguanylate cyclase (GGDEF)-like protein
MEVLNSWLRAIRSQAVVVLVVALSLTAAAAITLLERHVSASSDARSEVGTIELNLVSLENAPISATQSADLGLARTRIQADSRSISAGLRMLTAGDSPPASLLRARAAVDDAEVVVRRIFEIGAGSNNPALVRRELPEILTVVSALEVKSTGALGLLAEAGRIYSQRAARAKTEAIFGSLATILVLLSIFVLFYRRARVARAENVRLLAASRDEAITDPLTGIGNRRAFKRDLAQILPGVDPSDQLMVAMFDLDGFKQYNDTFGHAAGDALLARLAGRLKETALGSAAAYRMGGDEFCLIAQAGLEAGQRLVHSAVAALSDGGEGWRVGCSWGLAWMPSETTGASEALRLADERMYAQKTSRATASHQATAALVQVLVERDVDLSTHISRVAELASATARRLGVSEHEVTRIGLAAQLHDIGKTAIPESILAKPAPLDEDEWAFMRCHTMIGERIIAAAPSLSHTANLVRSSHERLDGNGYPDHLAGTDIPLGSRIIAVCDAFDAMVAPRPYRNPASAPDAITELGRCAGSQFDPDVVTAFSAVMLEREALAASTGHAPTR